MKEKLTTTRKILIAGTVGFAFAWVFLMVLLGKSHSLSVGTMVFAWVFLLTLVVNSYSDWREQTIHSIDTSARPRQMAAFVAIFLHLADKILLRIPKDKTK